MKSKLLCLMLLPLVISGCDFYYDYAVSITNLDTDEKQLKFKFNFIHKTRSIKILNESGSVILEGFSDTPMQMFEYPNSLDSIKLAYPLERKNIPVLYKTEIYHFNFQQSVTWKYEPYYATKEARWLFDEKGNQKDFIALYERWLGKDIIAIQTPDEVKFDLSSFIIQDTHGNIIEHKIKSKTNPSKQFALVLNKDQAKGKLLNLLIRSDKGIFTQGGHNYNKYIIKVPNNSDIGLVGKYNSL